MKNILLVLMVMIGIECFSQYQDNVILTKKSGKYIIENKGKEFDVNEKVLTIKPKDLSYFKNNSNIEIIRENKLGFIDIKVSDDEDIKEQAIDMRKTGLFDTVEYNTYGRHFYT